MEGKTDINIKFRMIRTELYYDFRLIVLEDYSEKIKFYEKYSSVFEKSESFENLNSRAEFIRHIHIVYQCGVAYNKTEDYKKATVIFERIIKLIEQNHENYRLDLNNEFYYINSLFEKAQALYYLKKYKDSEKNLKTIMDTGFANLVQSNWYMYAKYAFLLKHINGIILIIGVYMILFSNLIFPNSRTLNINVNIIGVLLMIFYLFDPSKILSRLLRKIHIIEFNKNLENRIDSITYYSEKIKENLNDYVSLIERGIEYNLEDKYELSLADLNAGLVINPTNLDGLYYRAICFQRLKIFDKAIVDYSALIELKYSDLAEIYNNRGYTYEILEKYESALKDYDKSIELEPYCSDYLFNRAYLYQSIERYSEAINDYNLVILYEPENAQALTNRGEAYYTLGNKDKAHTDFLKAQEFGYEDAIENLKKLEF